MAEPNFLLGIDLLTMQVFLEPIPHPFKFSHYFLLQSFELLLLCFVLVSPSHALIGMPQILAEYLLGKHSLVE